MVDANDEQRAEGQAPIVASGCDGHEVFVGCFVAISSPSRCLAPWPELTGAHRPTGARGSRVD